jgi:hypothetical protein
VDARLGSSRFLSKGSVVGIKGVKGERVLLDVTAEEARMEDVLRLMVHTSSPPLTGALPLTASFDLPLGEEDVVDKLRLAGSVTIADARLASGAVCAGIRRARLRRRGPCAGDGVGYADRPKALPAEAVR